MPRTAIIEVPFCHALPDMDGLAAVMFNGSDADPLGYLRLQRVSIEGRGGQHYQTTWFRKVHVQRISSISGGKDLTPVELDTDVASLPSQVRCLINAESHVQTDTIRGALPIHSTLNAANAGGMATRGWFSLQYRNNNGDIYCRRVLDSPVDPIVLQENEGVSLDVESLGRPIGMCVEMAVRNASSGAMYIFRTRAAAQGESSVDAPIISLWNGAGSGVVLQVVRISLPEEVGESAQIGRLRMATISGIRRRDGDDIQRTVTPVWLDTNASTPSGMVAYMGPFLPIYDGEDKGLPVDFYAGGAAFVAQQQNMGVIHNLVYPQMARDVSTTIPLPFNDVWNPRCEANCGIKLTSGRGIAVLAQGMGGSPVAEAAGACLRIRFEVTYHPGTETWSDPGESNVRSGTGYVANEIAKTGSLAVGGSSTYSRGRLVNA